MRRALAALAVTLVIACTGAAGAQDAGGAAGETVIPQTLPQPAYEPDLLRLSEVIGALAFLRDLCGAPDAVEWPARMQTLIESEGGARAEQLAGAYNRGYRAFALTYRVCTPSAERAIARYLVEGERLTANVARRFGG